MIPILWEFLTLIFDLYKIPINVDIWFFGVVHHIEFVPRAVIETILLDKRRIAVGDEACGLTELVGGDLNPLAHFPRTVGRIYLAEPDTVCRVEDLKFAVEHELRHVYEWIVNNVRRWDGHP
jgi:hypothetical protein